VIRSNLSSGAVSRILKARYIDGKKTPSSSDGRPLTVLPRPRPAIKQGHALAAPSACGSAGEGRAPIRQGRF
jgi:hypothetical protein